MKETYRFSTKTNLREWRIVNDGVMGSVSKSNLLITTEGYGQYFNYKNIEQISFLISNKQEEDFKLLIDNINMN